MHISGALVHVVHDRVTQSLTFPVTFILSRSSKSKYQLQIGTIQNHYLFVLPCNKSSPSSCRRRERRDGHTLRLDEHADVHWVRQQVARSRTRRHAVLRSPPADGKALKAPRQQRGFRQRRSTNFTDPLFHEQWHLYNRIPMARGAHRRDTNVLAAWESGYTGKGVVITVVDDGLQHDHPDLIANYDPLASKDLNDGDDDPYPDATQEINRHGTRCAGEIGAAANNGVCGVGVAYNSKIGGVRMLDGDVTDAVEAASLSLNPQHIDIYTNSWGPNDDGRAMEAPAPLATKAFKAGIKYGRGGKGSLFIFASGNGGSIDNCNADGYANAPYTIAVSAVDEFEGQPYYVEPCAAALASTFSSGDGGRAIATTDLHSKCTEMHSGTSAAAPIAAGILALVLEARPELTWRDVQYLMVHTATKNLPDHHSWYTNAAGLHHSHVFGFGLMDAKKLVDAANIWKLVTPKTVFQTQRYTFRSQFHALRVSNTSIAIAEAQGINKLEYVQVHVAINAKARGDVGIELTCPSGTPSTLLTNRPDRETGRFDFTFSTVRCWGESPLGVYRLVVSYGDADEKEAYMTANYDESRNKPASETGNEVVAWGLSVHGTTEGSVEDDRKQRSLDTIPAGKATVVRSASNTDPESTLSECNAEKGFALERHTDNPVHGDVCRQNTTNQQHCPVSCVGVAGSKPPYCVHSNMLLLPCRVSNDKQLAKRCKCSLLKGAEPTDKAFRNTFCDIIPVQECAKLKLRDVCEVTCSPLATKTELHAQFEGTVANLKAKYDHQIGFKDRHRTI